MIIITAKKWFQKSYGNTYHSVRVEKNGELVGYAPFQYGYGDHYLNTAAKLLGITEIELRKDIMASPENYNIVAVDVLRKKDL